MDMDEQLILQPYQYILKGSGKQVRSRLISAFNHWLKIPDDKIKLIGQVIEMLHNASLLVDDIEDDSILRRGIPVAHHVFGIPSTINAANYVYFLALSQIIDQFPPHLVKDAVTIYKDQLLELHRGQGMDIYWRDSLTCPTENQYMEMIKRKTGGLFHLGVRLMQLFSEQNYDFTSLIGTMGAFFQIRDDLANLKSKEYAENKSFAEDLTEGKFSFPVIHAIRSNEQDLTLLNIIRRRTKDIEIKKFAVGHMETCGSFKYTLTFLTQLEEELRRECQRLGGNSELLTLLEELSVSKFV